MNFKQLIGYKDFDTLVREAIDRFRQAGAKVTNLNPPGVFRTLIEMSVQGVADLYELLQAVVAQGFARTATGGWLDAKAADVGLTRNPAVKAEGVVTFSRATGASGNLLIPSGTIVRTPENEEGVALRYVTKESVVLVEGASAVDAAVVAEFPGAAYNVGEGMISVLVTQVPGIGGVTNRAGWLTVAGTDEETDESLRQRYFLRWHELSLGGTRDAYVSWAKSVDGVVDVAIDDDLPRGQGTVDVIITGAAGQPTQQLIDQVQAYIDTRKPLTANVLVRGPEVVLVDVDVLVSIPTTEGDEAAVRADVEAAVQALFGRGTDAAVRALRIGEDVYRSRLVSVIMARPHVVNVQVNTPAADVPVATGQLAALGVLNVAVQRVAV